MAASDGGNHHPLKPPPTCCGAPSESSPVLAVQPVLKPSPMISQQPVGQAATVAVRVVRVRSTVTAGGALRCMSATPSSKTSWLTSRPPTRPLAVLMRCVPAERRNGSQVVIFSGSPPSVATRPMGSPSMVNNVSSQ